MSLRKSNFELCRIICMLLIIMHHAVLHGGILGFQNCANKYIGLMFFPGGKICFDAFIVLSVWFLIDQSFKIEHFFRTWILTLFYSITFAVVAFELGGSSIHMGHKDWFSVFFPMAGNSHGFAAAYLGFYLLTPFLSIIRDHISRNLLQILIGILFYFQVVSRIISGITDYAPPILSNEVTLFVFFYFMILYYKKYCASTVGVKLKDSFLICMLIGIWIYSYCTYFIGFINPSGKTYKYMVLFVKDESSLFYIIGGMVLFLLFNNMKVFYNNKINYIAKSMFGILLYHDHNFFRPVLWHQVLKAQLFYDSPLFLAWLFGVTILIFTFGVIFDTIPRKLTGYLLRTKPFLNLSCKFSAYISA